MHELNLPFVSVFSFSAGNLPLKDSSRCTCSVMTKKNERRAAKALCPFRLLLVQIPGECESTLALNISENCYATSIEWDLSGGVTYTLLTLRSQVRGVFTLTIFLFLISTFLSQMANLNKIANPFSQLIECCVETMVVSVN